MTYTYYCEKCKKQTTVTKSIYVSSREERCEVCSSVMKRVYESVSVITGDGYKK